MIEQQYSIIDKRNSTIIKGVLILLIILGHNAYITAHVGGLFSYLYSFHVLSFFILPFLYGYKNDQPLKVKIKDKFISIYTPYIVFYTFQYFLFNFIIEKNGFDTWQFISSFLLGGNMTLKASAGFQYLWFMPAYFFTMVFRDIYMILNKKIQYCVLVVMLILSSLYCICNNTFLAYFNLPALLQAIYILPFGIVTNLILRKVHNLKPKLLLVLPLFLFICYSVALYMKVEIPIYVYIIIPVIFFMSLWLIITKYDHLFRNYIGDIFVGIGNLSLQIYLIHTFIFYAILAVLTKIGITNFYISAATTYLGTIVISFTISYLIMKIRIVRNFVFPR